MRKLKSSKTKSTHFIRGSLPPEARDIRNALYPSQAVSRPPTLQEKLAAFIKIKKIPGTDWYKRHTHLTWCSGKECEPARKAAKAAQGKIPVVEERTEGTVPPDGLNLHDILRARLRAVPDPPFSTVRAWAAAVGVGVQDIAKALDELFVAAEVGPVSARVPDEALPGAATAMPIICAHNAQAASPREEGQVAEGPYCYEYAEDDGDDTDGATVYSEAHHWQYSATKTVEDAASPGPSGWLESVPPSVSYHPDVPHNHSVNHPASVDTGYYAGGPFPFTGHPEVIEAHWREPLHSQMPSPSAYSPRTYDVSEFNPEGY